MLANVSQGCSNKLFTAVLGVCTVSHGYTTIYIQVYETAHIYIQVYETAHIYIQVYETAHIYIQVYETAHIYIQVYETAHIYIQVYETAHSSVSLSLSSLICYMCTSMYIYKVVCVCL